MRDGRVTSLEQLPLAHRNFICSPICRDFIRGGKKARGAVSVQMVQRPGTRMLLLVSSNLACGRTDTSYGSIAMWVGHNETFHRRKLSPAK